MLWTSITQKLRHTLRIILTYIAYESTVNLSIKGVNSLQIIFLVVLAGVLL